MRKHGCIDGYVYSGTWYEVVGVYGFAGRDTPPTFESEITAMLQSDPAEALIATSVRAEIVGGKPFNQGRTAENPAGWFVVSDKLAPHLLSTLDNFLPITSRVPWNAVIGYKGAMRARMGPYTPHAVWDSVVRTTAARNVSMYMDDDTVAMFVCRALVRHYERIFTRGEMMKKDRPYRSSNVLTCGFVPARGSKPAHYLVVLDSRSPNSSFCVNMNGEPHACGPTICMCVTPEYALQTCSCRSAKTRAWFGLTCRQYSARKRPVSEPPEATNSLMTNQVFALFGSAGSAAGEITAPPVSARWEATRRNLIRARIIGGSAGGSAGAGASTAGASAAGDRKRKAAQSDFECLRRVDAAITHEAKGRSPALAVAVEDDNCSTLTLSTAGSVAGAKKQFLSSKKARKQRTQDAMLKAMDEELPPAGPDFQARVAEMMGTTKK